MSKCSRYDNWRSHYVSFKIVCRKYKWWLCPGLIETVVEKKSNNLQHPLTPFLSACHWGTTSLLTKNVVCWQRVLLLCYLSVQCNAIFSGVSNSHSKFFVIFNTNGYNFSILLYCDCISMTGFGTTWKLLFNWSRRFFQTWHMTLSNS